MLQEDKKKEIIPALLRACPSFEPVWQEHVRFWAGEEAGIYNDLAEFVHYIINLHKAKESDSIRKAFETIEAFLKDGRPDVKEAVALGFLETLQCAASWQPFGSEAFEQWLGPVSKRYWIEIKEIWRGKSSLMDVVRAENARPSRRKPIPPEE